MPAKEGATHDALVLLSCWSLQLCWFLGYGLWNTTSVGPEEYSILRYPSSKSSRFVLFLN